MIDVGKGVVDLSRWSVRGVLLYIYYATHLMGRWRIRYVKVFMFKKNVVVVVVTEGIHSAGSRRRCRISRAETFHVVGLQVETRSIQTNNS